MVLVHPDIHSCSLNLLDCFFILEGFCLAIHLEAIVSNHKFAKALKYIELQSL